MSTIFRGIREPRNPWYVPPDHQNLHPSPSFLILHACTFDCEAILLKAGVGLAGDGTFDPTLFEGRVEVVRSERGTVGELEEPHAFDRAEGLGPERMNQ
jgi:hypothetical protein